MSDFEKYEGTSGDVAVIGESSNTSQISVQTLQAIYNELTGKSEKISKSFNKPIQVEFLDVQNLNNKILQALEQYNIVSENCSVTIFYIDDTKDRFSSFERFGLHNAGSSSSVESILFKYNFLILLPKTKQPQTYTISIRLASRVAVAKRMESEFYGIPPQIFRLMGNRSAVVEVEYIDYMVARNLINVFDEWFKAIPSGVENKFIQLLQVKSHLIPKVARFFTTIFVGFLLISLMKEFVKADESSLLVFGRFLGYSLLTVYSAYTISNW
jgi:hypothetical protein